VRSLDRDKRRTKVVHTSANRAHSRQLKNIDAIIFATREVRIRFEIENGVLRFASRRHMVKI